MLKIKDNIDLKELEKYGFRYNDDDNTYRLANHSVLTCTMISINAWNKKIKIYTYSGENKCHEILYDLIQAGLVEKVKE